MLTNSSKVSIDQLGRKVHIDGYPSRIVSTVPSISELLVDLGLKDRIVGVTKFCINPKSLIKNKEVIGGTKNLNLDKISELKPDLIIANKEENSRDQINSLSKQFPIWVSDVNTLESALEMISIIGTLCNSEKIAQIICKNIRIEFDALNSYISINKIIKQNAAYFIWKDPYMVAGADTFISNLMNFSAFTNVILSNRYPEITLKELSRLSLKYILLSSEPYPYKEKHIEKFKQLLPEARIILVDGEMYSWYGSHLLQAPSYFISLLKQLNLKNHL